MFNRIIPSIPQIGQSVQNKIRLQLAISIYIYMCIKSSSNRRRHLRRRSLMCMSFICNDCSHSPNFGVASCHAFIVRNGLGALQFSVGRVALWSHTLLLYLLKLWIWFMYMFFLNYFGVNIILCKPKIMYDEQNLPDNVQTTTVATQRPSTSQTGGALLPRCSMTTFLYRIAFTVWHAALHLERVGQGCVVCVVSSLSNHLASNKTNNQQKQTELTTLYLMPANQLIHTFALNPMIIWTARRWQYNYLLIFCATLK